MKKRVVVAMSGGVDSSVAAALLKRKGYEVIGITLCFNLGDIQTRKPKCCGIQGIEDARRVAYKLGIKHYVLNMQGILKEKVIRNFCQEYLCGRTPNPCIRCNQYIKFGALLDKAFSLGAQSLATGHYARIAKTKSGLMLRKARDLKKDQSYFLYRLRQKQLRHVLFPLGKYTKGQVRQLAREFNLPVADKLASQEICFIPDPDYRSFLKNQKNMDIVPGPVVDRKGRVLGQHKGIAFYTVGQRQGLGIAGKSPFYITKIDAESNRIVIGSKEDAYAKVLLVKELNFVFEPIKKKVAGKVKIRYNHPEAPAELIPQSGKIEVCFRRAQFAITPGQSAVFYKGDRVLGGGIIGKVLD